mgnify:CR=1 FL=1
MRKTTPKYKVKRQRTSRVRHSVARWWEDAVARGSQLNYGSHRQTIDYKGEGPWYHKVAIAALFTDYLYSPHRAYEDVTYREFVNALRRVVSLDYEQRYVRFHDDRGEIIHGRRVSFYRFRPHEQYRGFTTQQY